MKLFPKQQFYKPDNLRKYMLKRLSLMLFLLLVLISASMLIPLSSVLGSQLGLHSGLFAKLPPKATSLPEKSIPEVLSEFDASGSASTSPRISFNILTNFKDNVYIDGDLLVQGKGVFPVGIEAPNVVYTIKPGTGIRLGGDAQNPIIESDSVSSFQGQKGDVLLVGGNGIKVDGLNISSTGVTSIGGQSGDITLTGGAGITVNGTTISATNADAGSAQNIFKNIAVTGQSSIVAASNNDTLTFVPGTGITLTTDTTTKSLTIASSSILTASGFTDDGTVVRLSDPNDSVGIGTSSPLSKFSVGSNSEFQVSNAGAIAAATGITSSGTVTFSGLSGASKLIRVDSSGSLQVIPDGATGTFLGTDGAGNYTFSSPSGAGDITSVGSITSGAAFADTSADGQWLGLGSAAGRVEFHDLATDTVNILSANVGIGTSLPGYKLEVAGDIKVGDGGSSLILGSSASDPASAVDGSLYYRTSDNRFRCRENGAWKFCDTSTTGPLSGTGANGQVSYFSSSSTLSGSNLFFWDSVNNRLGIGTSTPGYALDVSGNVNATTATVGGITTANQAGLTINPYGASAGNTGEARFSELAANGSNYVGFKAPDSLTSNIIWTLPSSDGSANYVLTTNGAGVTSWQSVTGAGSVTGSGTTNTIPRFTSSNTIGDSGFTDNGSLLGLTRDVSFSATTPSIAIANTETLTITDGTNTLLSLADGGTSGNLSGIGNFTAGGTITFSGLSTGIAHVSSGGVISSSAVNLASADVTGSLGITNGGTGLGSTPTAGQLLIGNGSGYTLATIASGTGVSVTNGSGSITITNTGVTSLAGTTNQVTASAATGAVTLSLPQNIDTAANVNFGTVTTAAQGGLTVNPFNTAAGNTGEVRLKELSANGSNYIGFKAPDSIAGNVIWTLPSADGSSNFVLTTNGSGALSWQSVSGVGALSGSGTTNTIPRFTSASSIGDSGLTDNGSLIGISRDISFTASTPNIAINNTETFTITDGTNTLLTLADAGTSGNLSSINNLTAGGTITFSGLGTGIAHLSSGGVVSSSAVNLASGDVTGVLGISNGGTGTSSTPGNGQLLIGNSTGYTLASLSAGAGISVTNGSGSITVANTGVTSVTGTTNQVSVSGSTGAVTFSLPQSIDTGANVTFSTLTTTGQGSITANPYGVSAGNTGESRFKELAANGSNYVGFKGPDNIASNVIWTLPAADGSNNYVLTTNGSGVLTWNSVSGVGSLTGSGTTNTIPRFTGSSTLGDSGLTDNGSLIGITRDISFSASTPSIAISNTETLTITDGTNTLLSLADGGTSGNLSGIGNLTAGGTITFSGLGTGIAHFSSGGVVSSSAVNLASADVTGILGVANGGTGVSTTPTNGQLLIGNGSGYSVAALSAGTGIGITNASGSITVANTGVTSITGTTNQVTASAATGGVTLSLPQNIDTGANVIFNSLTTNGQGAVVVNPFNTAAGNTGEVRFKELTANGTNYVGFKAADALAGNVIWTLPSTDGSNNYVLTTNGAGVTSWSSVSGVGALSGSGTTNTIPRFTSASSIGDSGLTDDGSVIGITRDISFTAATPNIAITNTETLTVTDGTNTLLSLADAGTSGNLGGLNNITFGGISSGAAGSAGAPTYTFTGNTTTGIYSAGSNILNFGTNGSERARIDGSGYFGIGTSTPTTRLDVVGLNMNTDADTAVGMANFTQTISKNDTNTRTFNGIYVRPTLNTGASNANTTYNIFNIESQNTSQTGLTTNLFRAADGSTTRFLVQQAGNIVSTASTTAGTAFQFNYNNISTGNGGVFSLNGLTSGNGLAVQSAATGITGNLALISATADNAAITGNILKVENTGASTAATTLLVSNGGTGTSLRVNDDGTDTDATPFLVDASGNVGIGTSTPAVKLDVNGNARLANQGELRFGDASSNYVAFKAPSSATTTTYTLPAADGSSNYVLSTNGSGTLSWIAQSGGVSGTGTTNTIPRFTGASSLGDSGLTDNGTVIGITRDISFTATTPSIAITNTETLTITDGTNTLLSLADGGTSGNLSGIGNLTAGGTITFSGLGTGIAHFSSGGVISSSAVNLANSDVTGTLGIGNGGTGLASTPTNGQLLIGNGTGYTLAAITGTANQVTVTNGSGSITLSTPQDIATTSNVSFGSVTTSGQGAFVANPFNTGAGQTGESRYKELAANGSNYVGFKAPDNIASNVIWTLPSTDGSTNYVLTTNGSGVMSWSSVSGVGSLTGTGTTNTVPRFTASNSIGDSAITDDGSLVTLGRNTSLTGALSITSSTAKGILLNPYNTAAGNTAELRFGELAANGTNYVGFKAPDNVGSDVVWTLPSADGSNNYVLTTNGSGVLSWSSVSGAGGGSGFSGSGTTNFLTKFTGSTALGNSVVYDNGTNVGIGNSSPTSLLSVGSTSQFQVNSSGAIAAATGITSSGTITLSGLSTGVVHADSSGVLSSSAVNLANADVTGTLPVGNGGTGTATAFTTGSLVFAGSSGIYTQNNSNLFFDNTNSYLGLGNAAPVTRLDVTGLALNTDADNKVGIANLTGSVTKNDANTRTFTGLNIKETLNAGASNANTTINVLNVDTTNTAVTGVSTNLLKLAYGGSQKFVVTSGGALTATGAVTFSNYSTGIAHFDSAGAITSSAIALASADVSGTLGIGNGGTGVTGTPTNGQVLIGNGTGYTLAALTGGTGIGITNGSGSITIANTGVTSIAGTTNQVTASGATGAVTLSLPQNINTTANVNFGSVTTSGQAALTANPFNTGAGQTGEVRFSELAANGSNYVGFKAPDTLAGNQIWTLPSADGSSNYVLTTNGSGVTSWQSVSGIGGLSGSGTTNFLSKWSSSSALTNSLVFDDGTNVGIGNTAPNHLLTVGTPETPVVTTAAMGIYGVTGGAIRPYYIVRDTAADIESIFGNDSINNRTFVGSVTNHGTEIRTNNTARLTIDTSGNVGIGTTTPLSALDLSTGTGNKLLVYGSSGDKYGFGINTAELSQFIPGTGTNVYKFSFRRGSAYNGTEVASITDGGNFTAAGSLTVSSLSTGIAHISSGGLFSSSAINLASADVTGTLPIGNGGTGVTGTPTNGQLLIGNGTGYTLAAITGTTNQVSVTNGSGSITLSTPQDIGTSSNVSFGSVTTSGQGALVVNPFNTSAGNTGEVRYKELAANGSNYVGFKASDNLAGNVIWTLPSADGSSNYVLSTNGSGVTSWQSVSGIGGLSGSGTTNTIPRFTSSTALGDSGLTDNGSVIGISRDVSFTASTPNIAINDTETFTITDGTNTLFSLADAGTSGNLSGLNNLTAGGTITFSGLTTGIAHVSSGGVISSSAVNLASADVTGTLPIGNGGTGVTGTPTNGQLLIGNGSGYTLAALTGGTGIGITNASGSITVANTGVTSIAGTTNQVTASGATGAVTLSLPQNINTTAAVNFGSVTTSSQGGIVINPFNTGAGQTGEARFSELAANGSNYVGFKAPDTLAGNVIWTLPSADGSSNYVLSTNGSGVTSWQSVSGIGGLSGSGTTNTIPRFTSSTALGDSGLTDNGSVIGISRDISFTASTPSIAINNTETFTITDGTNTLLSLADGGTSGNLSGIGNLTAGGTITFSGLGTGIAHFSSGGVISSSAVNLASADVTGTLAIGNGGTGVTGTPTNGQLLIGNGSGYTLAAITGTTNQISVTNGSGTITLATPQDIGTASNVTFGSVTTSGQAGHTFNPYGSSSGNTGEVRFSELAANGSNYVGFKAADALAGNVIWTLPSADGSNNYVLSTNGSGILSWSSIASVGGITSLNGLTASTQTFATGTSGSDFNINSTGSTHTFNIPDAGASARGLVTTGTQTFAGAKTFSSAPTFSSLTAGSVFFAGTGGLVSQDNTGFFYDSTNHRLGLGTSTPAQILDVSTQALFRGGIQVQSAIVSNGDLTLKPAGGGNTILTSNGGSEVARFQANGNVGIGTSTPATRLDISGMTLNTDADGTVMGENITGSLTKNSTTTRTFYGLNINPTLNTGGSNTTTTFNAFNLDTTNTSTTGLTTNLMKLSYGGSQKLLLTSSGALTTAGAVTFSNYGTGIAHLDSSGNLTSSAVNLASADVTGILGVANGGTGTSTTFTQGSAIFAGASGVLSQDNTGYFYDATNHRLGIGTSAPPALLTVSRQNAGSDGEVARFLDSSGTKGLTITTGNSETIAMTGGSGTFSINGNGTSNLLFQTGGGNVAIGSGTANSRLDVTGFTLNTDADQTIGISTFANSITKNDTNTRTFYGFNIKPTLNTGASNTNTTFNVFNVDTTNTSVTGLTTNLLRLASGGVQKLLISDAGAVSSSSTTATGNAFGITANSLIGGNGFIAQSSSTSLTGNLGLFTATGNNAGVTGNILKVENTGASSAATTLMVSNAGTGAGFRVNDDGTDTDSTPFIIDASGNVGIGTTSLSYPLNVNGTANITGIAYVGSYVSTPHITSGSSLLLDTSSNSFDINLGANYMNVKAGGNVGIGNSVPATRLDITGLTLNTDADQKVMIENQTGSITKNDTNTRTFYGYNLKPTLNTGASNTNTTLNVFNVDTTNTAVTGLTTNLMRLAYGGSQRLLVGSAGNLQLTPSAANGIQLDPYNTSAGNTSELRFMELAANGANYTGFKAPDSLAGNLTYTLPSADGSNNYVLTTNGSGTLSWQSTSGIGGITGSGTTNFIPKFTSSTAQGNSQLYDDGTFVGIGTSTPATKLDIAGLALNTDADGTVMGENISGSITKNNTNTRTFYGFNLKPTLNTGASNTNTTFNVFNVDTTNTAVTGLTTNLMKLSYGGSQKLLLTSTGALTTAGAVTFSNYSTGIAHLDSSGALTSSAVNLASADVTGTLGVANGGTGTGTAFTQGSAIFAGASGVYSQDNANYFYDATNHRLGLGTTAPTNKLEVRSNGLASGAIINTLASGEFAALNTFTGGSQLVYRAGDYLLFGTWNDTAGSGFSEKMRLNSTGLGIGTTPNNALTVGGFADIGSGLTIGSTSQLASTKLFINDGTSVSGADSTTKLFVNSNGNGVVAQFNGAGAADEETLIGLSYRQGAGTAPVSFGYHVDTGQFSNFTKGSLVFKTRNTTSQVAPTERMRISSDGYVGIGTTAPATAVDVTGLTLNTDADGTVMAENLTGSLTKNDTNTRQFYGLKIKPIFNTGGSNANTTFNALDLDTTNTAVTGLTTNLMRLAYGGTQKFLVDSSGNTTIASLGTGLVKATSGLLSVASAGTDYQAPLTFSTGLTNTSGTITANLSTGISGGQSVIGGTGSGENLTLSSTSNGTKGKIIFGSASAYDEANDYLGLGNTAPTTKLDITGKTLNTDADLSVMAENITGNITKNSTTTRTFYGLFMKPTLNTGGSNTTTTFNALAIDTTNTSVTGLTTNLMKLSYGGTAKLTVDSNGFITMPTAPTASATTSNIALGTALSGGNTNGAYIGINAATSYAGDFFRFQENGTTRGRFYNASTPCLVIGDDGNNGCGNNSPLGLSPGAIDTNFDFTIAAHNTGSVILNPDTSTIIKSSSTETARFDSSFNFGLGNSAPATRFDETGLTLNTDADQKIGIMNLTNSLTKNSTATRTFYGVMIKPTINTGASNTNTTYNILNVDYTNTASTGVTTNLLRLADAGTTRFLVQSPGNIVGTASTTGGTAFQFNANSITTGVGANVAVNALAGGNGFSTTSSATAITGNLGLFSSTGNNASITGNILKVENTGASSAATSLMVSNAGTGAGFRVNDDGTDTDSTPFLIDASGNVGIGNTAPSTKLDVTGLTLNTDADQKVMIENQTGTITKNDTNTRQFYGLKIKPTLNTGASNTQTTFNVFDMDTTNTSVTGLTTNLFKLAYGGTQKLLIGSAGDMTATSTTTTTQAYTFQPNSVTTSTGFGINANGLTTGTGFSMASTSTALTTGNIANFDWSPGSATTATGDLLKLSVGSNGTIGNLLNLVNAGSSIFSVSQSALTTSLPANFTAAGDTSMSYDLAFTNQTSSAIRSNAPLTLDTGESWESNDLTFRTYNSGRIVAATGTGGMDLNTSSSGTQLRFGSDLTDSGGYLVSALGGQAVISGGGSWNGSNWIAKSTSNSLINLSSGSIAFNANTGLTTGNTFSPTTIATITTTGLGVGVASPTYKTSIVDTQSTNSVASIVNLSTATNTTTNVLRLAVGSSTTSTSPRFAIFYAGATTDSNGTAVGHINLNNNAVNYATTGADYGEYFDVSEPVDFGDIVAVSNTGVGKADGSSTQLLGVVSDSTGFTGNSPEADPQPNQKPVGLMGQIKTKVDTSNGPIKKGDFITASSVNRGVGAKADSASFAIGQALEDYNGQGIARIKIFVSSTYADPKNIAGKMTLDSNGYISMPKLKADQITLGTAGDLGTIVNTQAAQITQQESTIASLSSAQTTAQTNQTAINDRMDRMDHDIATMSASLAQVNTADVSHVASIEAGLASLEQRTTTLEETVASLSAKLNDLALSGVTASGSGALATSSATLDNLTVTANANVNNLGVTGTISAGNLMIEGLDTLNESSINTLGGTLKIQSLALNNVEFEAGKISMDTTGNMKIAGSITTSKLKVNTADVLSASAGKSTIPAGSTSIVVNTTAVKPESLVFVTATTKTGQVLSVSNQVAGSSFTVNIPAASASNITFNWWIVDAVQQ